MGRGQIPLGADGAVRRAGPAERGACRKNVPPVTAAMDSRPVWSSTGGASPRRTVSGAFLPDRGAWSTPRAWPGWHLSVPGVAGCAEGRMAGGAWTMPTSMHHGSVAPRAGSKTTPRGTRQQGVQDQETTRQTERSFCSSSPNLLHFPLPYYALPKQSVSSAPAKKSK
jgi:hypothetical protein